MSDAWRQATKPLILDGRIRLPYSWTVGRVGSQFFIGLRDHKRIMGNRCPECGEVWVPPRVRCPECFVEIMEKNWVEVGPVGILRHFTIVHYSHPAQPLEPPFAYGLINLDGASRNVTHMVSGTDLSGLKPGMRLKPVWRPNRQGSILDIAYFTPLGGLKD